MAQSAKAETEAAVEKAAATVSEIGKRTADKATEVSRQAAGKVEEMVATTTKTAKQAGRDSLEAGETIKQRSVEGFAEISQLFAELAAEQSRHGLATFRALATTYDWNEAAQIQAEFVRSSVERFTTFSRTYLETLQSIGSTALSVAKDSADRIAPR